MKNLLFVFAIYILFTVAGCSGCKNTITPTPDNPYGLPNATQTGAGTLGFLLNGQVWTPQGHTGTSANLQTNYDASYSKGIFTVASYRVINNTTQEYFGFGLDSLNFTPIPTTLLLGKSAAFGIRYTNNNCSYYSTYSDTDASGKLTISKLDTINRIISGTFEATFIKSGCDTIKITDGRFDLKF